MTRRAKSHALALLVLCGTLLVASVATVLTSTAAAAGGSSNSGSGGGGIGPAGSGPAGPAPSNSGNGSTAGGLVQAGNTKVQASGNGITIAARATVLVRSRLHFSGTVSGTRRGHIVEIQRSGRQKAGAWVVVSQARVRSGGSFTAVWPVNSSGRYAIRAVLASGPGSRVASRAAAASPTLTITVYRPAIATIFGPGFFGQRTACGQRLRRTTLGVANRTLPCGTPVSLLWHGRTMVVPVIDRGPYANHADWDLTSATATALGIRDTVTIGAVPLPRQASAGAPATR